MSEERHAVVRGPSFTGLGKRPSLQPCHQALLLTGMIAKTCGRRRKVVSVKIEDIVFPLLVVCAGFRCG